MTDKVLIVEDEAIQRLTLKDMCEEFGYEVREAEQGEEALFVLDNEQDIAVVMTDLSMPVMDGKEFIHTMRQRYTDIPIAVLTISRDLEDVVEVMKMGAQDFIPKPIEPERLKITLFNLLQNRSLRREVNRLRRRELSRVSFDDIIGATSSFHSVCELGRKMAASELPVLVTGETGVGKEEIAQAIHGESMRQGRPFVPVNCHAIPEHLADTILFGEVPEDGVLTDRRLGKCEEAQGGTLFLNGIEALGMKTQTMLLRLLQEGKMEPVGSTASIDMDVRVIAASSINLKEQVATQQFNDTLFYQLAALRLDVPPLRERLDDIEELAEHFMTRIAAMESKTKKNLSLEAIQWMQSYRWPGNVRELENLLSGAFYIANGMVITDQDLKILCEPTEENVIETNREGTVNLTAGNGTLKTLERVQDETIAYALSYHNQNVTKAAESLDIGRSTLFKRLKERQPKAA